MKSYERIKKTNNEYLRQLMKNKAVQLMTKTVKEYNVQINS